MLTAVSLDAALKTLTFAATDTHRLAVLEVPFAWQTGHEEVTRLLLLGDDPNAALASLLVPAAAFRHAAKILGDQPAVDVTVDQRGRQIAFTGGGRQLTVRLIEGVFPQYKTLLADTVGQQHATLPRGELLDTLDELRVYEADATPVRLTFDRHTGLTVECHQMDAGGGVGQLDLPAYNGPHLILAYNLGYLRTALKAVTGDDVHMYVSDETKPAVLCATAPQDEGYKQLVMPVRLPG